MLFEKMGDNLLILRAFAKQKPDEIAKILDEKDIKDEILIQVQEKFYDKISELIADAVKKFGNEKTQNLKGLIEVDIPNIQIFFDQPSFQNIKDP